MVLGHEISCGDLNLHWDWSPFDFISIAPKLVQEACWGNCSICMSSPLDPKLGLAFSFAMQRDLKFKKSPHFCCCQKCPRQFYKLANIPRFIYIFLCVE